MSNSIWKTPDQKPDQDHLILFFAGGSNFPYLGFYYKRFDTFQDWESKHVQKWCDIDDLIAQADKAERLQKAVDLAVHSFNEICAGVPSDIWVFDEATKATNEIEQLIKGE